MKWFWVVSSLEFVARNQLELVQKRQKKKRLEQFVVHSPHTTIWLRCNRWHMKDKQELLVAQSRALKAYTLKNKLESLSDDPVLLAKLRKNACEEVGKRWRLREVSSRWRMTSHRTLNIRGKREKQVECLYRFVQMDVTIEQIMKAFDHESAMVSISFEMVQEFVNQNTTQMYYSRSKIIYVE